MNKYINIIFLLILNTLQYNQPGGNDWNEAKEIAKQILIVMGGYIIIVSPIAYLKHKYWPPVPDSKDLKINELEAENKALKERLEKIENKNEESVEEVSLKEKLNPQLKEDEQGHFLVQNNFTEIKKTLDKILLPGQSVASNLGKSNLIKKACDLKELGVGLIRNRINKIEFDKSYNPLYFSNI